YHARFDAPLQSDIESVARNVSSWVRVPQTPDEVAPAAAEAVAAAYGPPGNVVTLVLPADTAWLDARAAAPPVPRRAAAEVEASTLAGVAKVLRSGEPAALFVGGAAVRDERGLVAAARVASSTGAKLLCETFPARLARGAGLPAVERLGYLSEFAEMQLAGLHHLVVVDTTAPVSFFAYPGKPSDLVPEGCEVHVLAAPGHDAQGALEALADLLGAAADEPPRVPALRPDRPTGALTGDTVAKAVGALLPDGAIVVDEANTQGLWIAGATAGAPRHDWLCLTGGAIGFGLPAATGAAVADASRKVVCLEADGSAMYTIQALWTQAREGLDVTTVVLDNRSYAILNLELDRVGAEPPGPRAKAMLELAPPDLDFVSIAKGLGVPATRATTADEFVTQFEAALRAEGPALVQAVLPTGLG
ncbi:MAG: acetolactate synthase large subunit, partial [Actinomycetota bacterium]|nr:acetolactate synthase large subunit [Actinomycetota bacterium]